MPPPVQTVKTAPVGQTVTGTGLPAGTIITQISGNTMRVGLKALSPGSYKVRWHALSVDTHTTEGSFTFHVGGH